VEGDDGGSRSPKLRSGICGFCGAAHRVDLGASEVVGLLAHTSLPRPDTSSARALGSGGGKKGGGRDTGRS
jgi:hypothetical protein